MPKKLPAVDYDLSVSVLTQLIRYITHLDMDINRILRAGNLDSSVLETGDGRIGITDYIAIEKEAARLSGDPFFGLHMGEFFETGNWSIIGYLMMNCATLGEAFEKAYRYSKIIGNLIIVKTRPGFGTFKTILYAHGYAPETLRHCYESILSNTMQMMEKLCGRKIPPVEVGFAYPPQGDISEYQKVFLCPVKFNQKNTYIINKMDIAAVPVIVHDREMLRYFEEYAKDYLARIESAEKTTRDVVRILLSNMDRKNISIASVADEMSMSVRTLQNRLKDEQTDFTNLVKDTRMQLARKYLKEHYSIEDITYLLGFSEASVFKKAFKKWTGMTPGEFRRLS